jgi:hypothetical protein
LEGNKNYEGGKIEGQVGRGPINTFAGLNRKTHINQLGSNMVKNKENKGSNVEDVSVICQQR